MYYNYSGSTCLEAKYDREKSDELLQNHEHGTPMQRLQWDKPSACHRVTINDIHVGYVVTGREMFGSRKYWIPTDVDFNPIGQHYDSLKMATYHCAWESKVGRPLLSIKEQNAARRAAKEKEGE